MVPAIQLDRELRQRAIEVEEVRAAGVLAAELEFGEPPVTEQPPKLLLGRSGFLAKMPREIPCVIRARAVLAEMFEAHGFLLPLPHRGRGLG